MSIVSSAREGSLGGLESRAGLDLPAVVALGENRHAVERQRIEQVLDDRRERVGRRGRGRQSNERLGLGSRPCGFGRTPSHRRDEPRDDDRHADEDDEREHVVSVIDGPCVQGWEEEPVRVERRRDRRQQRRPGAADRGGRDDDQEEEQEHRRQLEAVAERDQRGGEQRGKHDRECPAEPPPPRCDRDAMSRPRSERKWECVAILGFLRADDVHVDGSRAANDSVHDRTRSELGPPRAS